MCGAFWHECLHRPIYSDWKPAPPSESILRTNKKTAPSCVCTRVRRNWLWSCMLSIILASMATLATARWDMTNKHTLMCMGGARTLWLGPVCLCAKRQPTVCSSKASLMGLLCTELSKNQRQSKDGQITLRIILNFHKLYTIRKPVSRALSSVSFVLFCFIL